MSEEGLFLGKSAFTGPLWKFTYDGLELDIPYTSIHLSFGQWSAHALTWCTSLLFCFLVTCVFPRLKPSNPETIKKIAFWHYFLLFSFSLVSCLATVYLMISRGEVFDRTAFYCNQVPDWYRVLSIMFTFSKYWEWLDTCILVWRGKTLYDIGFLHFYHHMTTVWVFSIITNFPGSDKLGLLMNGGVHTLMYYHYAFRLPTFFRPIITFAQIVQLAFGTFAWDWNYVQCSEFRGFREQHWYLYYSLWMFVPVFLLFFCRFFFQTYVSPVLFKQPKSLVTKSTPTDTKQKIA